MAKVYSWEVSKSPAKYAYIVHPNDYSKAYVGTELKATNLEKVKEWASNCTDSEYEQQFQKMVDLCTSKGYNVSFETVTAYLDVNSSCDNLRGPAGRGIDHIALYSTDVITNISTYIIYYDDNTTDTFQIKNGRDGKDGIDGTPGAKGDEGVSSKFIMIYTSGKDEHGNLFTPQRPEGGSYDFNTNKITYPTGWEANDSEIIPPVWMSSRTFTTSEASTDKQWSLPVQITGETGAPGVDGISTEFIYKLVDAKPTVEGLLSPNESGYVPDEKTGWTASPTGVDENHTTEWASLRKYDTKNKVWGQWEEPFIWSKYGVNGQDGDGIQYIFLKNRGELPENPTPVDFQTNTAYQNKDNEWIPEAGLSYINIYGDVVKFNAIENVDPESGITPAGVWSDNPSDVTSQYHSQWVSTRKYRKNSDGKMSWDKYSDPALWSHFGQDGKNATSIRKLYALSSSTSNPPALPGDSTITGDWGTGFPIDYIAGENVVWGTEAEIWSHNNEFVMTYKVVSTRDGEGNVIPPADATEVNTIETTYLPDTKVEGYTYIRYDGDYYEWSGGWCTPYLVTGLKGDNGNPTDYTTYVFAYGYKDYIPPQPNGTHVDDPGYSIDDAGNYIIWEDFPLTSDNRVDGVVDSQNRERRWFQCAGHVLGENGEIYKWGDVVPANPHDGEMGSNGCYTEFRFGVTKTGTKPTLEVIDDFGNVRREPILKEDGIQVGWYTTDELLPEIPKGGAMWQIWATIDGTDDSVMTVNGRTWNGPRRVSGEQGEQGIQGPAGLRGVTGIPGATSLQMYCLGTYGKNITSESYWKTGGVNGGDGYFGSTLWEDGVIPEKLEGWFTSTEMPYSDFVDVTTDGEFDAVVNDSKYKGRVIRYIKVNTTNVEESQFVTKTHTFYLVTQDEEGQFKQLTNELPDSEEFNVYIWCVQGNEVWEAGTVKKYVDTTTYDKDGIIVPPSDSDSLNTCDVDEIPAEQNELYKYLRHTANGKYYEWQEIQGDRVKHRLVRIDWGSPFKLQGTNGLRGLTGSRGQVVYPMGVYNHEEVYITTEDKAPYVYDSSDGMFYVLNEPNLYWVGELPENYKTIKTQDGKYKYSLDGTGNAGTWIENDQRGDIPSKNYANAVAENKKPAWVRFESFQALYTSIAIIQNGMIGSAVYNNEFMFSQQGINEKNEPTNYAIVSEKGTEYGFLSGYVYDEKGETIDGTPTGRHWKYRDTGKYIDNFAVNPYEKKGEGANAPYIHTFMPNVCINFATGQMWLATGQIHFGCKETNVTTTEYIDTLKDDLKDSIDDAEGHFNEISEQLKEWASDQYISPSEMIALKLEYDNIVAEYTYITKQVENCGLKGTKAYSDYQTAYTNATAALQYYTNPENCKEGSDSILIGDNYANIKKYYEVYQELLAYINEFLNDNITSTSELLVGDNGIIAQVNALNTTTGEHTTSILNLNQVSASLETRVTGVENTITESGFVTSEGFAEVFATKIEEDRDNALKASIKTYIDKNVSSIELSAEQVLIDGKVTINKCFTVDEDGNVELQNLKMRGYTYSVFKRIADSDAEYIGSNCYRLKNNLYVDATGASVQLPVSPAYEGARVLIMSSAFVKTRVYIDPTTITTQDGTPIISGLFADNVIDAIFEARTLTIDCGVVELVLQNCGIQDSNGTTEYKLRWVLINNSCQYISWLGRDGNTYDHYMFGNPHRIVNAYANITLTKNNEIVHITTSDEITISLPKTPRIDQKIEIFQPHQAAFTINGNGNTIYRLNEGSAVDSVSYSKNKGRRYIELIYIGYQWISRHENYGS